MTRDEIVDELAAMVPAGSYVGNPEALVRSLIEAYHDRLPRSARRVSELFEPDEPVEYVGLDPGSVTPGVVDRIEDNPIVHETLWVRFGDDPEARAINSDVVRHVSYRCGHRGCPPISRRNPGPCPHGLRWIDLRSEA